MNQGFLWLFSPSWGVKEICSFRLVLEGETGKEILESSRLEFLEKCFQQTTLLYQMEKATPLGC